jgi:hypothetical protein
MILNSPTISGSLTVTGNIITSGSITLSGSVASASYAATASFVALAQSASNAVSAQTASFANAFTVASTLTAQTLVVQTITSSVDFVTGSTRFGTLSSNTHIFTGSLNVTGALYIATGSVGIGTVSPSQLFEVVGGEIKAGRVDSSNEGGQVSFGRSTDNATAWYIDAYGNTASPQLRFVNVTNAVVAMTITGSNVGIGTSSPDIFGRGDAMNVGISATGASDNMSLQLNAGGSGGRGAQIYMGQGGTRHFTISSNVSESTLGTTSNTPLRFTTNDAPKMTITSDGNVLIGSSTNNGYKSYILQTTNREGLTVECTNASFDYSALLIKTARTTTGGNYRFTTFNNGTSDKLYVIDSGGIYSNVTTITPITSDVNLKTDIIDYDKGLNEVLAMKPRYFKYKNNLEEQKIGFIAQEIGNALEGSMINSSEKNKQTGENYKTYQVDWYPLLVNAIKELKATNDDLQSQINELKAQ